LLFKFYHFIFEYKLLKVKRREAIKGSITAATSFVVATSIKEDWMNDFEVTKTKGKINHSACRWCYSKMPLEELADKAKSLGLKSIELLNPDEWDVMLKRGMTCAISNGGSLGITKGFNDVQFHDQLQKEYEKIIPMAADKGIPNIIVFSGNRGSISDKIGMEHSAKGLDKLVKLAEKHKVNLIMELLNSKVDHKDYMCDNTKWGASLVDKIGSPNFKLLYDIYHMQIMEGDVIATIKKYKEYIGHYHTGGVPGRNEINDTQELNYKAIMNAIVFTGYKGYVAQEFIPTRTKPMESLKEAIKICDIG
jgi:hydroxypyruvate isomerase